MDEKLIARLINKPSKGLNEIMDKYVSLIYSIIYRRLNSICQNGDIEEMVSDVFFTVYENRENIDLEKSSLKNYLCIIAKRILLIREFQEVLKN